MSTRIQLIAVALCAAACGDVATAPIDGGVATTYKRHVDMTPAIPFGGLPFCDYTMTLKQLDVELAIEASGTVRSAKVQDLNFETVLDSTPPCPEGAITPNIASYTLASATPAADGTMLTFLAASSNEPDVVLTGTLTSAGAVKTVKLGFQRINVEDDVLAWTIVVTAALTAP